MKLSKQLERCEEEGREAGPPPWRFRPSRIEIVCLAAGVALTFAYAWLMDDAYVYFRYADNFALLERGLVWNANEYVEGFSSPLWALLLCGVRLLRADFWIFVLLFGALSYLGFWYLACLVNRGLTPKGGDQPSFNLPLVYLGFNYGVLCYFTSGLEGPLINMTAALYAAGILWPRSRIFQGLIGLTPLVRHEFMLPLMLFIAWSAAGRKVRPLWTVLTLALAGGGYGLFRVAYYADLFPNTFYLKDTTLVLQGLKYLKDATLPYFMPVYAAAAAVLLWRASREGATAARHRLAMLAVAISVAAYVVRIGGDARHFRYLAFPYVLGVLSTGGLLESAVASLPRFTPMRVMAGLLLLGFGVGLCYPPQLSRHPVSRSDYRFEHRAVDDINDAAWHRLHPDRVTPPLIATLDGTIEAERKETGTGRGPDVVLDLGNCRRAYVAIDSPVIQSFGLTDPFLARTSMRADRPAHKYGLLPLASDLQAIRSRYGFEAGAFDRAIADGDAPGWVLANIESLRQIEAKAYNDHRPRENLALALAPAARIEP